jgi:predicted MFS family arabinose efflux permease
VSSARQPSSTRPLPLELAALTVGRLFINTGLRMVYPFLPALARGLGVSLPALSALVSVRGFAGLLSPLFGPLSERYGRRPVLVASMLIFTLGCLIVVVWPKYWPFGLTLALISLAKVIYDPAMQAYVGDRVRYAQRGKALAVTELSWAGAFLLGVPVLGFAMQRQGWQAPFVWLALAGLASALLLRWALPSADGRSGQVSDLRTTLRVLRQYPVIWVAAVYVLLVMGANELLLIVYGGWMEGSFGLNLTNLGMATGVIGGAEVVGEIATGVAVDRYGKRPVILTAGLLTTIMYVAIPFTGRSLTSALVSLFLLFLFFEMTVVGGVPLMTEIVPGARGVVMSMVLATGGLGRALGALLGPTVWLRGGFGLLGISAGLIMLVSLFLLARWIREGGPEADLGRPLR